MPHACYDTKNQIIYVILIVDLGFVDLLLRDQMNLLQGAWLDILCFNIAFRSSPYKGVLIFADDFVMSDGDSSTFCIPLELNVMLRKLARKLTELALMREEYVLMKVMLLMNPGTYAVLMDGK